VTGRAAGELHSFPPRGTLALKPEGPTMSTARFALCLLLTATPAVAQDKPVSAVTPDGRHTAVAAGATIGVFDVATGKEIMAIKGHTSAVTALTFSPDGKMLVSGGKDKTVRVFDAATGKALIQLNGHAGAVTSVAFSTDGKAIVTKDDEGKTLKWDPATGKRVE
jgi:WD40 repeat protein